MAYNKTQHLRDNIEAIRTAFELERNGRKASAEQQETVQKFSGFGGLKCILMPCREDSDSVHWVKSEQRLFPLTRELWQVIRENSKTEEEFKSYQQSLQTSVLSAFYTPQAISAAIADSLSRNGITPGNFLDPSAGTGAFLSSFATLSGSAHCFENDLLTGKILRAVHPEASVNIQGFEQINARYKNYFDLISSNIPFGDFAVFDPDFSRKGDKIRSQAAKTIHNYFFLKAVDVVREGGIIAFITSQGVMNSPSNEGIRRYLMERNNLVSAVRLPNNLFSDSAGTEVGSDLIILQKNSAKNKLSFRETDFIHTRNLPNGISVNNYFYTLDRVLHTSGGLKTDQYGKPALEFIHHGDVEAMAVDLAKILDVDCRLHLNIRLYEKHKISQAADTKNKVEPQENNPVLNLYELFGFTAQEHAQIKETTERQSGQKQSKPIQIELFSSSESFEKRKYENKQEPFFKEGMLLFDKEQVGYLKEGFFDPIRIDKQQKYRIREYISLRDAHFRLFAYVEKTVK